MGRVVVADRADGLVETDQGSSAPCEPAFAAPRRSTVADSRPLMSWVVIVIYGLLLTLLAIHLLRYLGYAFRAVRFPFELDYGEGIVWQQALLMLTDRMYGDITRYPFIVFEYPPFYHLVVRAVAWPGSDVLTMGRAVSVMATLALAVLAGLLSYDATRALTGRRAASIGAVVAGLTVFCTWPVILWSPLMRVDMLAFALSLAGIYLAGRKRGMIPAVLCFVMAFYTRQTCVAAPLAVLAVMLPVEPARTVRAYCIGGIVGLAVLLAMNGATDGGFLRHLVFYNLQRFTFLHNMQLVLEGWMQAPLLLLAIAGLYVAWKGVPLEAVRARGGIRALLRGSPTMRSIAILSLYFGLSFAVVAVTIGKSAAGVNYLIEWIATWCVLIGILVAHIMQSPVETLAGDGHIHAASVSPRVAAGVGVILIFQVAIVPAEAPIPGSDPVGMAQQAALVERVRDTPGEVLSDDMVLLLRAGKPVPWERTIVTELALVGKWDETLAIDRIRRHAFAMVITTGSPARKLAATGFTPAVARAIEDSYPREERVFGHTLRMP